MLMKVYTSSGIYEIKEHRVKILPSYFEAQVNNSKNFEIRKNDRNYQVGDLLLLEEYNPTTANYTGREVHCLITYKTTFKQVPGYVVLGTKKLGTV
ncbi:DUF3850 domain-containing protein [Lactobacillus crispatus]|uniref:DUF3850 domain-containing protein n=2 Tax=Lactobacillus crispatus TaxID=47770 RepID=A0A5M9YZB8_9LACO|nr:DUF3850 domain-containing protein [Lactobacillus crispatus]MBW9143910.1 DUF3850 domain-containing protein [Lactobacillus crispatus]ORE75336.1 hypothetical protein B6C82_10395 [Lactobacillus crispatus]QWW28365.1 DUF3850 domain-containing protein [Lactobacillus crispatus]